MKIFEDRLKSEVASGSVPGAVVAAVNADGSFAYSNAFGWRKLGDDEGNGRLPYEVDSVLRVASCTKLLTSIAVLQCIERGLIALEDDVLPLLPSLAKKQVLVKCTEEEEVLEDLKGPLTLRQLITHSSGTLSGSMDKLLATYRKRHGTENELWTSATIEDRFNVPFGFQPDSAWGYGSGHDWAGRVVETLTKQTLEEHFRKHISEPLGLKSITFFPDNHPNVFAHTAECAKRHPVTNTVIPCPEYPPFKATDCFGGGGVAASMPDYLKVLQSLLRNDGVLLKPATVDEMFKPQLSAAAHKSFNDAMVTYLGEGIPGFFPPTIEYDWGLGAMLMIGDRPGVKPDERLSPRGDGTLTWGGYPNLCWFIDRKNDLAGIYGTLILPMGDKKTQELTALWENELYKFAGKQ